MDELIDSRLDHLTLGYGGVSRPRIWSDGHHQRCYCVNCGASGGWATIPEDGLITIIYLCQKCEATVGALPLPRAD